MADKQQQAIESIQRSVVRMIATSPAGVNLLLIGGFRLRLLDHSERFSVDIDYHWGGDLDLKQQELLQLCRRVVLGGIHRQLEYEGSASILKGPDSESLNARFLDLRFWKGNDLLEIPLEITSIACLDPPIVRTADGTVHLTPSDADIIESKIIAVFNRIFLQHRDLVDLFLFQDKFLSDSRTRLKNKVANLAVNPAAITRRIKDLEDNRDYHARAIQKIIESQLNPAVVEQINRAGGGRTLLDSVIALIHKVVPV